MRLRNIPGSQEVIAACPFVVKEPESHRGHWRGYFGNENPVHIEVGMGKGKFLMTLAAAHPHVNYIGIERYTSVLLRAVQERREQPLSNLCFVCMDAADLEAVFAPGEVSRIYLNFSDPWPKDRHAKRRLPSAVFLARYDTILCADGRVEFKTDNRGLFDFAVEEAELAGWETERLTYDLHGDAVMMQDNVMTEYEERFSAAGNPICKYVLYRRGKKKPREV